MTTTVVTPPLHVGIVNNKKFSDIAVVTKDNNTVYTLSAILEVRCPQLYTKEVRLKKGAKYYLENPCEKKEALIVFLHYIYSGYLPAKCPPIEDLIRSVEVAKFLELPSIGHYENEVNRKIYSLCTRKNVFKLLNQYTKVKDVCLAYIVDHWDSFSTQKLNEVQVTFLYPKD
jgi:hypothetical protein